MRVLNRSRFLRWACLAGLWLLPTASPAGEAAGGAPASEPAGAITATQLFATSDQCMACHNGLVDSAGQDISIGTDWRASMMANAARDPYWQAAVRREALDHPKAQAAIEAECSICHMPMARVTAHAAGGQGEIFANLPVGASQAPLATLAGDGVGCSLCHQIQADLLGQRESMVGRFVIDTKTAWTKRVIHGPFEVDAGRSRIMGSSSLFDPKQAAHIRESGLCGSCHTLYTHSLGPDGQAVGELAEQVPYQEWLHSRYPQTSSCQACHMRQVEGPVAISSVWGQPREPVSQHVFRGGNFFVARLLNVHRTELGVTALPQELEAASIRTIEHLKESAARLHINGQLAAGLVEARIAIRNLAGHKLPSAYPSRRVWLHIVVRDNTGRVLFESGALQPDGSIAGNDNDADASKYEAHHERIESSEQVQIYEPILAAPDGSVTTGLLTASRYLKDNRLLPEGFDKATAGWDIAVAGAAAADPDFVDGGDVVGLRVAVGQAAGPLTVSAHLYYQPIGFRWAHNLAGRGAPEPDRFVRIYQQAAHRSAVLMTSTEALLADGPAAGKPAEPAPAPPASE
jgi:hypothetical protein